MKKFHPMALLLKFEGYPPAVIASVFMHACLFLFILGRNVDPSDFMTVEDPVIITATAIDVNPQRLRRLERIEQERIETQRQREQAQRDARARQEREASEARARQEAEQTRIREEAQRQEAIARQRAADDEAQRQRQANEARAREAEQARVREQRQIAQEQATREAAERAEQEALENQIASENLIVAQYVTIIRRIISQSWQIPPSARNGMSATVRLQLVPTGEVVAVNVIESSGNDVFDRSVLQAVERAERFPELQDLENPVFERNFRTFTLVFRPEDLLR